MRPHVEKTGGEELKQETENFSSDLKMHLAGHNKEALTLEMHLSFCSGGASDHGRHTSVLLTSKPGVLINLSCQDNRKQITLHLYLAHKATVMSSEGLEERKVS